MKRTIWAIAPLAIAFAAAPALAQTGFNGFYDYSTWTSVATDGGPVYSSIDGPQQTLTLYEPDANWDWVPQEFQFSHVVAASGTVSFDWVFDATGDSCCSGLNFYVNGNLANLTGGYFGNSYNFSSDYVTGSYSVAVNAGDTITFGAFSADGCCGPSINTITNFQAPGGVPEPASWAMMVGGFGLVGGAMRSRRKTAVRFA